MEKVTVCIKVRGLTNNEKESVSEGVLSKVVKCSSDYKLNVGDKSYTDFPTFGPDVTDFYSSSPLQAMIKQGLSKGISIGIMCMGDSKSGKSTTTGEIVSDSARLIFDRLNAGDAHFVGVSYLNIYQDKITDLLNPCDKEVKVRGNTGSYLPHNYPHVYNLSQLSVKSPADLLRLFAQGNKVRKILELEMSTPSTLCHTVFIIFVEYKNQDDSITRCELQFCNIAGLNLYKHEAVSNSLKSLDNFISHHISSSDTTEQYNCASQLTQVLKTVLNKSNYVCVIGQLNPTSAEAATRTLDVLRKLQQINLHPEPCHISLDKIIADLRSRVATARSAITAAETSNIPKEHIAELENSLAALGTAKGLQWGERETASNLAEEQRTQTLADQGVLEWIKDTRNSAAKSSSKVVLLHTQKEELVRDYKTQRKVVDDLKHELQSSIQQHTDLAESPAAAQTPSLLQDSLTKIHKLRDELKEGNETLRDLKKRVRDVQDTLKFERGRTSDEDESSTGNFELRYLLHRDELTSLKKDNEVFLQEEQERLQSEAEQEIAEVQLGSAQGKVLTLEQVVELQNKLATQTSQLSHLALHVQCLQAENEKLTETVENLRSAHKTESETTKMRNLLVFRQYKDFYEEEKSAMSTKYQELLNSAIQDALFLSSQNAELVEENTQLKRKLKHYS